MLHLSYRMSLTLKNFIFIAVSTHSHIPCHSEAHYKLTLYNSSLSICFFFYNNLRSWFKQYKLPVQCTLTQDMWYTSPQWDPVGSCIVTDVYMHSPANINNWECTREKARYCMLLLLQQYWLELVNMCNSGFLTL